MELAGTEVSTGSQVELRRTVDPTAVDVGDCASAGGVDLAFAAAAVVLAPLRGSRRRSPGSR